MPILDTSQSLARLLNNPHLWRGNQYQGAANGLGGTGLPSGYPELDACLPWQGWPANALVEVISADWGVGELQLVLPLLRSLSGQGKWILWIAPPCLPYAPGLALAGVNTAQIIVINAGITPTQTLWSIEKALQNKACALVLAWPGRLSGKHIRRLQLAASTGQTLGVIFHHSNIRHSASALRLRLESSGFALQVSILKVRGSYHRDCIHLKRPVP